VGVVLITGIAQVQQDTISCTVNAAAAGGVAQQSMQDRLFGLKHLALLTAL